MVLREEPMDVVGCVVISPNEEQASSSTAHSVEKPTTTAAVASVSHQKARSQQRCSDSVIKDRVKQAGKWIEQMDPEQRELFIVLLMRDFDTETLEAVDRTLARVRQHRHNEALNEKLSQIERLPIDVAMEIFGLLDPKSLCRCALVCRQWRRICDEPILWKRLCRHKTLYRMCNEAAESAQVAAHRTSRGTVRWKEAFSERYRLWCNWHAGRCVIRTFEGHTGGISCVQFDSDRIVSGSYDTTIRLWDIRQDQNLAEAAHSLGNMALNGHSSTVRCLHLISNVLASGSNDFTIKIWNVDVHPGWSSIGCKRTMLQHQHYVRCLQMDEDYLLSGSYDMTMKLWSLSSGQCIKTLEGHNAAVICMQFDAASGRAVSGSGDHSIKCWDTRVGSSVMTIHNAHGQSVTCIRFDDERIVSGGVDKMIKMWDLRTGRCMNTIDWRQAEGHTGVVRCLQADAWRMVSGADDRTIKVWSIESASRLCTLQSHKDGVTCVQFNDRQIVSGSYDKTVKLWDFSTF